MARRGKVIRLRGTRPAQPEPAPDGALVEVLRCRSQAEALVIRSLLDAEGIPSVLRSHLVQSLHPFTVGDLGEVVVLVPPVEAERARQVLAQPDLPP